MLVKLELLNLKGNPILRTELFSTLRQMLPKIKILSPNLEIHPFSRFQSYLQNAQDIDLCELATKEMLKSRVPPVKQVDFISLESFYPSPILKRKKQEEESINNVDSFLEFQDLLNSAPTRQVNPSSLPTESKAKEFIETSKFPLEESKQGHGRKKSQISETFTFQNEENQMKISSMLSTKNILSTESVIVEETEGTERKSPLRAMKCQQNETSSSIPLQESEVEERVESKKGPSEKIKSMSAVKGSTPLFLKKSIIRFKTKQAPQNKTSRDFSCIMRDPNVLRVINTEGDNFDYEEEEDERDATERSRSKNLQQTPTHKQEMIYCKRFSNSFSKEEIKNLKTKVQNKVVVVKKSEIQREKPRSEPLLAMMVAPARSVSQSKTQSNFITPRTGGRRPGASHSDSLDRNFGRRKPFTPQRQNMKSFGTFHNTPVTSEKTKKADIGGESAKSVKSPSFSCSIANGIENSFESAWRYSRNLSISPEKRKKRHIEMSGIESSILKDVGNRSSIYSGMNTIRLANNADVSDFVFSSEEPEASTRKNLQKIFKRNKIDPHLNQSMRISPSRNQRNQKQSARSFVTDSVKSPRVLQFTTHSDFVSSPMKIALHQDMRPRRELCIYSSSKRNLRDQAPTPQLGGLGSKRRVTTESTVMSDERRATRIGSQALRIDLRKARGANAV